MATNTDQITEQENVEQPYHVDRQRLEGETDEQYRVRRLREGVKHRRKTHRADIDNRVEQVIDMLAAGRTVWDVRRACNQLWGVNPHTIDRYISAGRSKMEIVTGRSRDSWRLEQLTRYKACADNADVPWKDRINASARIDRIIGLEQWGPPSLQRIEVSGPGGGAIQSTVAVLSIDLAAKLAEYQAALSQSAKSNLIETTSQVIDPKDDK